MIAIAATLVIALSPARAQQGTPAARTMGGFPYDQFHARELVADWMVAYDMCGWVTSDSLAAHLTSDEQHRLGSEWFCYQDNGKWHALYGRYDASTDAYDAVAQFADTGRGHFVRTAVAPPASALPITRALAATTQRLPKEATAVRARFNTFVREAPGGPEVWVLPAWQPNGWVLWGMEFRYAYDSAGRVLRDSTVVLAPLRGSRPDTTLNLRIDSSSPDVPTVGETFFMLRYHALFRGVRVYTPRFVTEFFDHDGKRAWMTAVRDTAKQSAAPPGHP